MIQLLNRNEIDTTKWDTCIHGSKKPLVYALHWFLDVVSPGWKALVIDDYAAVVPLPIRHKLGLSWNLQPLFCQQLGFFSKHMKPPVDEIISFFKKTSFGYQLALNQQHGLVNVAEKVNEKQNQIIHLIFDYETLHNNYSKSTRKNLRKVQSNNWQFKELSLPELIAFFCSEYGKILGVPKQVFATYQRAFEAASLHANAKAVGLVMDGEILAAMGLIYDHMHMHTLMVASETGKRHKALPFLIDSVIKEFAASGRIFDFGGSDIESIAYFFSGFGTSVETYAICRGSKWLPDLLLKKFMG